MQRHSRRNFIKTSLGLSLASTITSAFDYKKYQPLLSFSTLGCPDWSLEKILDFAATHNYNGIELRGIQREMDLPKLQLFGKENINTTKQKFADKNLKIVDLGSSAAMHLPKGSERDKSMDEAKRFIDLAEQLQCPYIRVFPNNLPKEQEQKQTLDLISEGLTMLADYAKNTTVTVLMETHGDVVQSDLIKQIMQQVNHPKVALVWDPINMWFKTKEPPVQVYSILKTYIRHAHIKDLNIVDGKESYVLLGAGEAPIFEAINALAKDNYKGYFSFEWEKLWHPEIADPEIALADYPVKMAKHFEIQ